MRILFRRFGEEVALILEARAVTLLDVAATIPEEMASEHPAFKNMREQMKPKSSTGKDGICRIPIEGTLAHNPDTMEMAYFGMEDMRNISNLIDEAMNDSGVKGVLLAVDSPGGFFNGGVDLADKIAACDAVKPVVAHVGGTCASLAYMLASQASEIVAGKSAVVGSLGAYSMNVDVSRYLKNLGIEYNMFKNKEGKYKGMGDPTQPLTGDHREFLQGRAQATFETFMGVIQSKRPNIPPEAAQGQTFYGSQAKDLGLVDRIGDESFARGLIGQKAKTLALKQKQRDENAPPFQR